MLLKLIKFKDEPTPDQLIKQLHALNNRFDQFASSQKSMSIELEEGVSPAIRAPLHHKKK